MNTPSTPAPPAALRRPRLSSGIVVAAAGAALGLYLVVTSRSFPAGYGSLPGPGFFPFILGILILVFSAMIAWEARPAAPVPAAAPSPSAPFPAASILLPLAALLTIALWLFSWAWMPFLLRTPILVLALMRLSGSTWRAASIAALLFTATVYAIFQLGLRVDLG
ncbi:MAG: tripartite tricarboxylate transporter TctB family protein [Bryobacterales bacterium]|nr:tripartite tricarboxylate transporter TctB family protein [Bryobacterales bacterium]